VIYAFRKPMSIVDRHCRSCVVTHDMPLLKTLLNPDLFKFSGKQLQMLGGIGNTRTPAKPGQIDSEARKLPTQSLDDSVPQVTARRHSMYEQHRRARSTREQIHPPPLGIQQPVVSTDCDKSLQTRYTTHVAARKK